MNSMMNFSEMDLKKFSKNVQKNLEEFALVPNEVISLSFYNCLIISQKECFDIRQNQPFGDLYIVNL